MEKKQLQQLAEAVAVLDGRPAHPEDYKDDVFDIVMKVGFDTFKFRLQQIQVKCLSQPSIVNGYISLLTYFRTGEYHDDYTNQLLFKATV